MMNGFRPPCPPRSIEQQICDLQLQLDALKRIVTPTQYLGEWNDTTNYNAAGMQVSYDGSSYVKRIDGDAVNFAPNINPEKWQLVAAEGQAGTDGKDGTDGAQGPRGLTGTGLSHITMGSPYISGQQTVTPLNFEYTDGTSQELAAYAQNGSGGGSDLYLHCIWIQDSDNFNYIAWVISPRSVAFDSLSLLAYIGDSNGYPINGKDLLLTRRISPQIFYNGTTMRIKYITIDGGTATGINVNEKNATIKQDDFVLLKL